MNLRDSRNTFSMNVKLSNVSKTLFFHYYPAWIAWSGIYCIVLSSLNWEPELTFISLFIQAQLQVVFVYLFIIESLYFLKPSNNHVHLVTIFAAMIVSVICWETGSFFVERQISLSGPGYRFSIGFIGLRIFSEIINRLRQNQALATSLRISRPSKV